MVVIHRRVRLELARSYDIARCTWCGEEAKLNNGPFLHGDKRPAAGPELGR
jgi:hypothetical protein